MKTFTYNDIKSWEPCYDPIRYISETWQGTVVDILSLESIPFQDRIWCVLRTELISEKVMRLFAVWAYRQTLKFIKNPDPRSIEAANVAEKLALGEATEEELSAARSAAWSVESATSATVSSWSAARSAAWFSARSAWYTAWSVESTAWSAASTTRLAAAWYAVWSAVWSAARSAAWSVESATSATVSSWSAQRDKLIEMIIEEEKTK